MTTCCSSYYSYSEVADVSDTTALLALLKQTSVFGWRITTAFLPAPTQRARTINSYQKRV